MLLSFCPASNFQRERLNDKPLHILPCCWSDDLFLLAQWTRSLQASWFGRGDLKIHCDFLASDELLWGLQIRFELCSFCLLAAMDVVRQVREVRRLKTSTWRVQHGADWVQQQQQQQQQSGTNKNCGLLNTHRLTLSPQWGRNYDWSLPVVFLTSPIISQ